MYGKEKFTQTRQTIESLNRKIEKVQSQGERGQGESNEGGRQSLGRPQTQRKGKNDIYKSRRGSTRPSSKFLSRQSRQTYDNVRRRQTNGPRNMGRRQDRTVYKMGRQLKNTFPVPVSNTFSYERGMELWEPKRTYRDNGECMMYQGVDFVTSLVVDSLDSTTPGKSSDVVFVQPIAPIFFPGTELYKEAQGWTKWKYNHVRIRYIPSCTSTTSGALLAFGQTDISVGVWGTHSDSVQRIREALSRRGAKVFHPFMETVIDIPVPESDELIWYDVFIDSESEHTVPAQYYVMIETPLSEINATPLIVAGQLMIDYSIEFCSKAVIDTPITLKDKRVDPTPGTTIQTFFVVPTAGEPVKMKSAPFGSSLDPNIICIFYSTTNFVNSTTSGTEYVETPISNVAVLFAAQGDVWYGFTVPESTDPPSIYCTPSFEDAVLKNLERCYQWSNTITITDLAQMGYRVSFLDISAQL
jgi:hypothetical protein